MSVGQTNNPFPEAREESQMPAEMRSEMPAGSPWKLRFAPNIGLNSLDTPLFRHCVGSLDPLEHVEFIADRGFAGVEDNFLKIRPPAEQARMGAALARRGLSMGCFVANPESWNKPLWVSREADARAKLADDLRTSIDAAQRAGGRVMTVITGADSKLPRSYQFAAMVDNLRLLAPAAEQAGVVMGLEACNSWEYPSLFLNDVRDAYAMAQAVDSPSVGIVFDIYHVQMMTGDVIRNLRHCWDRIATVQVADNPGRGEAGTGELNWVNIFRVLAQEGFTGLVELEHEVSAAGAAGERAVLDSLGAINAQI
jgi:hydroxypyruvate isomerase